MNNASPPTITPPLRGNNRRDGQRVVPTREQLASCDVRALKLGQRDKADLLLVDVGAGPTVVKDFRSKAWWVRWIGRLLIARELRAYRILGSLEGVPQLVGRIDAHAFAFEWIDGQPLGQAPDRTIDGEQKLQQLRVILDRIHARGVVHWDLRGRDNVLVDQQGRLWVVDFASAIYLRPGGWAYRLLFRWFELIDESALLKWKRILEAGPYTEREQAFMHRFRFWRSLWFHRRQDWRRKGTKPRT